MDKLIMLTPELKSAGIVFIFIAIDIITGIFKALYTGTYTSSIMREGLFHKLGEIIALFFASFCDYALPLLGVTLPFTVSTGVVIYIAVMETGSIIENLGIINPELGKYLSGIFEKIKDNTKNDR